MTMLMKMQGLFGHQPTTIMDSESTIPYESESTIPYYEQDDTNSQEDDGPLHSCPMPLEEFMAVQKSHAKDSKGKTKDVRSSLKRSHSKKHLNKKKGEKSRSIRFATNPENENVWCVVNTFEKVQEKYHPDVWWQRHNFAEWSRANMNSAQYAEEGYCERLIQAYASIDPNKERKSYNVTHRDIERVELKCDCPKLAKIGDIARGLEALVYPPINRIVKRQSNAVLNMQEILEDQGVDILESNEAMDRIAHTAAKYSYASRVFAKKLADFDAYQARLACEDVQSEKPKRRHSSRKKVRESESSHRSSHSSKHKSSKDHDKTERKSLKRHESDASDHHKKSSSKHHSSSKDDDKHHHGKDDDKAERKSPKRRVSTEAKSSKDKHKSSKDKHHSKNDGGEKKH